MCVEYNEWLKEVESGIRERIFCNVTWDTENGGITVESAVFNVMVSTKTDGDILKKLYDYHYSANDIANAICKDIKLKWLELIEKKEDAKNA